MYRYGDERSARLLRAVLQASSKHTRRPLRFRRIDAWPW